MFILFYLVIFTTFIKSDEVGKMATCNLFRSLLFSFTFFNCYIFYHRQRGKERVVSYNRSRKCIVGNETASRRAIAPQPRKVLKDQRELDKKREEMTRMAIES